jgi:hypothetical protein
VFAPKQMSREQLMDGYVWLYEEAYASSRALDRLERYWSKYRRRRSTLTENLFLKWKLRGIRGRSARVDALNADGWTRMRHDGVTADAGQLLYYLDSADFVDYLQRFRSASYAEHVELFRSGGSEAHAMQWENERIKKRAPAA